MSSIFLIAWVVATFLLHTVTARYYDAQCCSSAVVSNVFDPTPSQAVTCGQEYNSSLPAAPKLYVPYRFCVKNCDGFGLSMVNKPSQWAAPIVQFILPSVIFSMGIPRRKMFSPAIKWYPGKNTSQCGTGGHHSKYKRFGLGLLQFLWSFIANVLQLFAVIVDNIVWIAIILTFAGPMMLSALYEAVLDWQIISTLFTSVPRSMGDRFVMELLTTVVSGNLLPSPESRIDNNRSQEGNPQVEIPDKLLSSQDAETRRTQLIGLVNAQMGYGAAVGGPVLFYLGAFVYTILDLSNKPSDQDAAISLAFGVEWMIIVHVAIVAGGVLATNNPSAASILVGKLPFQEPRWLRKIRTMSVLGNHEQPGFWAKLRHGELWRFRLVDDIFDNRYQPVTIWRRGENKKAWIRASLLYNTNNTNNNNNNNNNTNSNQQAISELKKCLRVRTWQNVVFVLWPTFILINVPPAAAAVVAYATPPIGWGCRSLTFVSYAFSQVMVSVFYLMSHVIPTADEMRISFPKRLTSSTFKLHKLVAPFNKWLSRLLHALFYLLFAFFSFVALFVVLGGTLMQVIGVYRNCLCYVNVPDWLHLDRASVQVSTDTQEQRDSNRNWIVFGGVATAFMGFCCFCGWWYQKVIRERYRRVVDEHSRPGGSVGQ